MQDQTPWDGSGWLFPCVRCGQQFAFARGVEVEESIQELAVADLERRARNQTSYGAGAGEGSYGGDGSEGSGGSGGRDASYGGDGIEGHNGSDFSAGRGDNGPPPGEEAVGRWVEWMTVLLRAVEVDREYVYLDGFYIPADLGAIQFDGFFARHDLPWVPQTQALDDPTVVDQILTEVDYWEQNKI